MKFLPLDTMYMNYQDATGPIHSISRRSLVNHTGPDEILFTIGERKAEEVNHKEESVSSNGS